MASLLFPRHRLRHASASALRPRSGPCSGQVSRLLSQRSLPAWFVRGGTSNGLVVRRQDLPCASPDTWRPVLAPAMGSPDPVAARQLDGMGSGVSSTSKVVVVAPSARPDAHVEYTFVQVGIRDGALDVAGNCGNMSSIVGPAAWDMGLVDEGAKQAALTEEAQSAAGRCRRWAVLRMRNTNTNKVIVSRFAVAGDPPVYDPDGGYVLDGVPGTGSPITLSFLDPAGAKTGRALPTGNPLDRLQLPDGTAVDASLVDVGNPGVFVAATSLGLDPVAACALTPPLVETDTSLKARLEQIRRAGASRMGLDPDTESVPKIVLVMPPRQPHGCTDSAPAADLSCLAMSMGQAHKAVPLTLALCLAAAARIPGSVPEAALAGQRPKALGSALTIAHPSGRLDVDTSTTADGTTILSADLLRTARVLMKGQVFYSAPT
ncbi:hypothetical protein HIM_03347 [Hirsutella minnesotensis 3608]|uniref:3-methylitaconate isomerase n=1 Tax=Hirsutella minnesotensis 3608 TaxID=1043627 RepID=A0A0F7ZM72_9HYPO|nr:hypothetical protein HIM_03347 [Hirsutella minnesotensis 3608]